jgi:hypothetical protein
MLDARGAPCGCGGFRESGTFAIAGESEATLRHLPRSRILQNGILTLPLVVMESRCRTRDACGR